MLATFTGLPVKGQAPRPPTPPGPDFPGHTRGAAVRHAFFDNVLDKLSWGYAWVGRLAG